MGSGWRDSPRALAGRMESTSVATAGASECFRGYGVFGVSFASGHALAVQRTAASSTGPPHTSVWHHDPQLGWTIFTEVPPGQAYGRIFGTETSRYVQDDVDISWVDEYCFSVRVRNARLAWVIGMKASWAPPLLGILTGKLLGLGRIAVDCKTPGGHRFAIEVKRCWTVATSVARLAGDHLGPLVLPRVQLRLGELWLPRWGLFVVGRSFFESGWDHEPGRARPAKQPAMEAGGPAGLADR